MIKHNKAWAGIIALFIIVTGVSLFVSCDGQPLGERPAIFWLNQGFEKKYPNLVKDRAVRHDYFTKRIASDLDNFLIKEGWLRKMLQARYDDFVQNYSTADAKGDRWFIAYQGEDLAVVGRFRVAGNRFIVSDKIEPLEKDFQRISYRMKAAPMPDLWICYNQSGPWVNIGKTTDLPNFGIEVVVGTAKLFNKDIHVAWDIYGFGAEQDTNSVSYGFVTYLTSWFINPDDIKDGRLQYDGRYLVKNPSLDEIDAALKSVRQNVRVAR